MVAKIQKASISRKTLESANFFGEYDKFQDGSFASALLLVF
jgi:hypothetical protein